MATAFVRIALGIALMVEVWRCAHWAPALALTLVWLRAEAQDTYAQAARNAARKAQRESERLAEHL